MIAKGEDKQGQLNLCISI